MVQQASTEDYNSLLLHEEVLDNEIGVQTPRQAHPKQNYNHSSTIGYKMGNMAAE